MDRTLTLTPRPRRWVQEWEELLVRSCPAIIVAAETATVQGTRETLAHKMIHRYEEDPWCSSTVWLLST